MKRTLALLAAVMLLALLLSGCGSTKAIYGSYQSEDGTTIINFEDLCYLITEDEVIPTTLLRSLDGTGIQAIGGQKVQASLSEDGTVLTLNGETFRKIPRFPGVTWRLIKAGSQASIEDSATGVLGWLVSPAVFEGRNGWANYGLFGAGLADVGIILLIVVVISIYGRINAKKR